ncbi:hypothetical protein EU527_15665 [Candidatus Thorarchaeota archaeon]|nr:MAG: hypothetical protein EU527_15665 [Candidatus Thorarchaeota archaeon]
MQNEIIDTFLNLFSDPLILILTLWIVGVIVGIAVFRRPKGSKEEKPEKKAKKPKIKVKGPLMKQMDKMMNEAEKGKELTVPPVRSRDEIITDMFESKMNSIGLQASTASGYIPMSYTPLARFLKERGVPEDTVNAIITGILEEENETDVRAIIEATAESPEVNLVGEELEKAKQLAVDEWSHIKKPQES